MIPATEPKVRFVGLLVGVSMGSDSEYTRIWREETLGSLEFIHARYRTHSFPRHMHETYVFYAPETGAHSLRVNGREEPIRIGQLIALDPGRVSSVTPGAEGYAYRGIYPTSQALQDAMANFEDAPVAPQFTEPIVDDPDTAKKLVELVREVESGGDRLECEFMLNEFLVTLIERHANHKPSQLQRKDESKAFERARDFIHTHFADPISIKDMSRVARLSQYQLARVFEREVRVPPHAYCINVRVNHARKLLAAGTPIGEAAIDSGFTDQSHLTRWFKRLAGVTPGQYC